MRRALAAVALCFAACGGGASPPAQEPAPEPEAPAEETTEIENTAPPAEATSEGAELGAYGYEPTGAAECDELVSLTMCTYEKAGDAVPAEAIAAFQEGVRAWRDALANPDTRQATIDACKLALDGGMAAYEAVGCAPSGAAP